MFHNWAQCYVALVGTTSYLCYTCNILLGKGTPPPPPCLHINEKRYISMKQILKETYPNTKVHCVHIARSSSQKNELKGNANKEMSVQ